MPLFKVEKLSLLETLGKQRVEAYVVFSPANGAWWGRLLKKNYGHASLFIRQGCFYIWIEPSIGFTEARVIPITWNIRDLLPENTEIIKVIRWREIKKHRIKHIFAPFTCVEQIKSFLGLENPLLFTPWQLRNCLKNED